MSRLFDCNITAFLVRIQIVTQPLQTSVQRVRAYFRIYAKFLNFALKIDSIYACERESRDHYFSIIIITQSEQ